MQVKCGARMFLLSKLPSKSVLGIKMFIWCGAWTALLKSVGELDSYWL